MRAFPFISSLLLSIRTRPVRRMAETCRVMTTIAVPLALLPSVWCRAILAPQLRVEKSLLNRQTPGLPVTVWVTESCRPRLLDIPELFRVTGSVQFLGPVLTNLAVRVTEVVPPTFVLATRVLLNPRPSLTALSNRMFPRGIQFKRSRSRLRGTLCILTLLTAMWLLAILQKWGTRPSRSDPL